MISFFAFQSSPTAIDCTNNKIDPDQFLLWKNSKVPSIPSHSRGIQEEKRRKHFSTKQFSAKKYTTYVNVSRRRRGPFGENAGC